MSKIRTFVVATALALSAQAVHAADNISVSHTQLSRTVSYADLDLNRSEGISVLYKRLNSAAKNVCAPLEGRLLSQKQNYKECVGEALSNAIADVNQPLLTQHYRNKDSKAATAIVAKR